MLIITLEKGESVAGIVIKGDKVPSDLADLQLGMCFNTIQIVPHLQPWWA